MSSSRKKQGGFFKIIILVIIAVLILAYFKVDVRGYIESPEGQAFLARARSIFELIWAYIKGPTLYVYNQVFMDIVFPTAKNLFEALSKWLIAQLANSTSK